MKVAIAHDYLNQYGGAERVLESLLKIFPHADIYTLLYDKERTGSRFDSQDITTSFLNSKFVSHHHRPFIPFMPAAISSLNLKDKYDLIISDTAGYAKGITYAPDTFHLSYCYTPLRYAWETEDYFSSRLFKAAFSPAFTYLKNWDRKMAHKPDVMLTISDFIAGKIKNFYGRKAEVVYPPVDHKKFYYRAANSKPPAHPYYLGAGRLLGYKRFDLIINAFRSLELPLKIVGTGSKEGALRRLASGKKNIEFISSVSDDELRLLYAGASAFIFPQVEDFGLVAAEAQSCGTPVVAFRGGGAAEIVEDGVTGVLFKEQEVMSLIKAIQQAQKMKFDRARIAKKMKKFSYDAFKKGIIGHIPASLRKR